MTTQAECARCGRTFGPDTRHVQAEYSYYPPESKADELGDIADFCPECSRSFEEWMADE